MIGQYTVELYKIDGRYKEGKKLLSKKDHVELSKEDLTELYTLKYPSPKFEFKIYDTWVTRKNHLDGKPFIERYDVPYYCSPSSETFWSS
jgi:hypothetical protein